MARLTVILETHQRRHGQIGRLAPGVDEMDWYAIYIDEGPASKPCWSWTGLSWTPCH